ncbi:Putative aconitase A/isopropylmalate dehydratase small subunit, swivel domain, Aconitase, domain 2 [Septoria linicola]|uniref:Aconitate hydratase, mitochondrial n=1 Tax=Septoria linicola TaxID=215465 RepID=A0A9Q9EMF3_9PEZI|nr:putative aconitase A/isopropylmalate dehydratase small subunit, swivel domain, Aconitase, domain 2 [Septoria linicola]USW55980.1 Putative aconitase A/isopropylmalate dehydratase small subunit, swivel domain, Aconitase, domain 2 [Septoria linicola]
MALLQFISAGLPKTAVPTTIHSDHLVVTEHGGDADLENASSACKKYDIGYWQAGSGILHIIVLENYAFPGGLIIGTDSHTPNASGMSMLGIGVGGSDAVDAMAGMPWEILCPNIIGVRLTGTLSGWSSSKDIVLKLAGMLTVSGGRGKIIEFFGPGTQSLSATAMATVCNMSAEIGSTSCIFPWEESMDLYLRATGRDFVADAAQQNCNLIKADKGSEEYYDEVLEIDLETLEPHINGPFTPDLSHPLSQFADDVQKSSWPKNISQAMVGSCTNSSYEDLTKVVNMVREAESAGLKPKVPFLITAGTEKIRATIKAEGNLDELESAGATILSSSCGPCVGHWAQEGASEHVPNSVISSYNRNFTGRHDGNPETHSFVTSPELTTAFAYHGKAFKFTPPKSKELPRSFAPGEALYQAPASTEDSADVRVTIDPNSDCLQRLKPFRQWQLGNALSMTVLAEVKGKCTTDHISPAGPWYKYRGHLENISNNLLTGAENAFLSRSNGESLQARGQAINRLDHSIDTIPQVAKAYKDREVRWCIIGDDNYGEGSSREHAALEPRFLGGIAVIAKSFARIHETNLKKQGILALTFAEASAWDSVEATDVVSVMDVESIRPGQQLVMKVGRADGTYWHTPLNHTYHQGQIPWLMEGSALNHVKRLRGQAADA